MKMRNVFKITSVKLYLVLEVSSQFHLEKNPRARLKSHRREEREEETKRKEKASEY